MVWGTFTSVTTSRRRLWGRKQADGYVVDRLVISGDVSVHNTSGLDPVNKQVLVLLQQQELPQHHVDLVEAIIVDVVPRGIDEVLVVILTAAPGVVVVAGEGSLSLAVDQVNSSGRTIVKTFWLDFLPIPAACLTTDDLKI